MIAKILDHLPSLQSAQTRARPEWTIQPGKAARGAKHMEPSYPAWKPGGVSHRRGRSNRLSRLFWVAAILDAEGRKHAGAPAAVGRLLRAECGLVSMFAGACATVIARDGARAVGPQTTEFDRAGGGRRRIVDWEGDCS
jgi:hypothetical protein